jgi:acetylornithine deacetylase/succinyl-diaminopimelate desuccinylase-like protein
MWLTIGAGQKIHQVVTMEVINQGGHSTRPVPDNAIYQLSLALKKVERHAFPVELNDVVKASFLARGPLEGGELGAAMTAFAKDQSDAKALAVLAADPDTNPQLRTTCVATQLEAGHAPNALPQRAKATLSCRAMQTLSGDELVAQLQAVVGDPSVKVALERKRDPSPPAVLTEEFMGPVRKAVAKLWPGLPIVPSMGAGANDGRFLLAAGVQTYGVSGILSVPGESNAHGLNEKIRTKSL